MQTTSKIQSDKERDKITAFYDDGKIYLQRWDKVIGSLDYDEAFDLMIKLGDLRGEMEADSIKQFNEDSIGWNER